MTGDAALASSGGLADPDVKRLLGQLLNATLSNAGRTGGALGAALNGASRQAYSQALWGVNS